MGFFTICTSAYTYALFIFLLFFYLYITSYHLFLAIHTTQGHASVSWDGSCSWRGGMLQEHWSNEARKDQQKAREDTKEFMKAKKEQEENNKGLKMVD